MAVSDYGETIVIPQRCIPEAQKIAPVIRINAVEPMIAYLLRTDEPLVELWLDRRYISLEDSSMYRRPFRADMAQELSSIGVPVFYEVDSPYKKGLTLYILSFSEKGQRLLNNFDVSHDELRRNTAVVGSKIVPWRSQEQYAKRYQLNKAAGIESDRWIGERQKPLFPF